MKSFLFAAIGPMLVGLVWFNLEPSLAPLALVTIGLVNGLLTEAGYRWPKQMANAKKLLCSPFINAIEWAWREQHFEMGCFYLITMGVSSSIKLFLVDAKYDQWNLVGALLLLLATCALPFFLSLTGGVEKIGTILQGVYSSVRNGATFTVSVLVFDATYILVGDRHFSTESMMCGALLFAYVIALYFLSRDYGIGAHVKPIRVVDVAPLFHRS